MPERRFVTRALDAILRRLREPAQPVRLVHDSPAALAGSPLLAGRKALVTGAGRKIGRAIALEMAAQGADIYFTDIDAASIEPLERELIDAGVRARGYVSDVSKVADIESLCAAIASEDALIDVLVNNVGVTVDDSLQRFDIDATRAVFETNVFGPLLLTKRVVDALVAAGRPGSVLFLSTIHEERTYATLSYSGSKGALAMIVKELALELAPMNIRVNAIAPSAVAADGDELRPIPMVPLHQASIHPTYIGRAAVYLAADYFSQFTTGSVVTIDAGILSRTPWQ